MKPILLCWPLVLACACSGDSKTQAADNTARNARDKNGQALTPMDQLENEADRGITQKVRQSLMGDAALSTNAQNVKVITRNGKVTLRGVVASQAEKGDIEAKAKAVPGVFECDDQLEVKTN
jgi:hyperosmotically inducible protein